MTYRLLKYFLEELEDLLRKRSKNAPSKFLKDLEEAKAAVEKLLPYF